MLRHYRRFWIIAIAILLVTPLTVGLLTPAADHLASAEYRAAAPPPALPRSLAEWNSLPREVDLYLADRFGLRTPMIYARALVAQGLLHSGNASVMIGRDG